MDFNRSISVEEAISLVGGYHRYQVRLLLICALGQLSAAFFVMGLPYMLAPPKIECVDDDCCHISEDSAHNFTYEFKLVCDTEYKTALIGTFYFLGMMIGAAVLS